MEKWPDFVMYNYIKNQTNKKHDFLSAEVAKNMLKICFNMYTCKNHISSYKT